VTAARANEDVYFDLLGRDNTRCVVPQCSPATDQLFERPLHLPGFDSDAFGKAMTSTENPTFLCWRQSKSISASADEG
jgi:hypothetical protein